MNRVDVPGRRGRLGAVGAAGALVAVVAVWAIAAAALRKPFLPPPGAAFARLVSVDPAVSLGVHLGASARRVFLALLLAAPAAAVLGLAAGRSPRIDAIVSPLAYVLHPLPKIAFLPVIMLFLGLGDAAKIFLIGLVIFGQILVTCRDAARAIPEDLVESVRALGASRGQVLRHVIAPATLPSFLSAIRIGLGTSIAVLFMAETFASDSGLGWYIVDAWTRVDYPGMYAAIVALSVLALACYLALDAIESRACRWRDRD